MHLATVRQQQAAYKDWLLAVRLDRPVAVTLTLKQGIQRADGTWTRLTQSIAAEAVSYFFNELERRCFPKKKGKRAGCIYRIAVWEGGENQRLHYHLQLSRPEHVTFADFESKIEAAWKKADWAYNQVDIKASNKGWLNYMLKTRTKSNYNDALCVKNLHLPQ